MAKARKIFRKMSPGRLLALGFASIIILGASVLLLPFSANKGVRVAPVDALFTATSAVCVTGLVTVDTADTFNGIGRTVVALLIQMGGLGVATIAISFILLSRGDVNFKERVLVKEAFNLESLRGVVKFIKFILLTTLCFEVAGTALNYIVFSRDYPPLKALGISVFHSISAFNNAGLDILGGFRNLLPYQKDVLLNLTTCGLIIFGGLGFYVIRDIIVKRSFRKLSLHSKIVIVMTAALLFSGTVLLKLNEDISWLGAFFFSTSARTAGFSTYALSGFSNAGLFVLIILMFIGASPGSTGGGIKTTTAFTMIRQAYSTALNKHFTVMKREVPGEIILKAFLLAFLAAALVCVNTLILCMLEPDFSFIQLLFETVSAFGTVGLSTGITPELKASSKLVLIITMFIGRTGPLTIATLWSVKTSPNVSYSEESIAIG